MVEKELRAALAGEGPQLFGVSKDLQKGCQELGPAIAIKGLVRGGGEEGPDCCGGRFMCWEEHRNREEGLLLAALDKRAAAR